MTDASTPIELSEADKNDIEEMFAEEPTQRTVLEVWTKLLESIDVSALDKVSIHAANRIVMQWPQLRFSDLPKYNTRYHEIFILMRDVVAEQVALHPDAFENVSDDAVANHGAYVEIIFGWQAVILKLEHEWDASDPDCAIELAAIADVSSAVVGNQGLVEHLSQIRFQFDEAQQEAVTLRLQEYQGAL